MNIKRQETKNTEPQFEQKQTKFDKINVSLMTDSLLQFEFESGIIMGKINSGIDTRIGLKYHAENTKDFNSFLESVQKFIEVSGHKLTKKDANRLKTEYSKY